MIKPQRQKYKVRFGFTGELTEVTATNHEHAALSFGKAYWNDLYDYKRHITDFTPTISVWDEQERRKRFVFKIDLRFSVREDV